MPCSFVHELIVPGVICSCLKQLCEVNRAIFSFTCGAQKRESSMVGGITGFLLLLLSRLDIRPEAVTVWPFNKVVVELLNCRDIKRSSIIQRVCYDAGTGHMVINVKGSYYEYCRVPENAYLELMGAFSMGRYYEQHIQAVAGERHFVCAREP